MVEQVNLSNPLGSSQGSGDHLEVAIATQNAQMQVKSGKQTLNILKGIDWKIPKGNIELLMGPSGSGKTTLLSILAGLLTPTVGRVELLGQEITTMSRRQRTKFRRQHIGFIFQDFNLFPALNAVENVEITLNLRGIKGKEAYTQAEVALEQVGLADHLRQLPKDLSGGQKQRVAIARALTGHPQLIMADEPTASLDSTSGHRVMELLRRLAKEEGCTVLIVTHDPRIADLADQVAFIEDGQLKR